MRGNAAWHVVNRGPPAINGVPFATQRSTIAATDVRWTSMPLTIT